MKLKYVGQVSPIPLYKTGQTIQTGEVVDLKPEYAAELMAQFPGKFVEPGTEADKKKPGRPPKEEPKEAAAPEKNKIADPSAKK